MRESNLGGWPNRQLKPQRLQAKDRLRACALSMCAVMRLLQVEV